MRAKLIANFAIILSAAAAFPLAAKAAPQILGLLATATPLPLSCVEGVCSVEVSGVCLQEHRPAPLTGTAYRVAEGSELTLVVQNRAGLRRTLAVAGLVEIRSLRVFSSVSVSLPEQLIDKLAGDGVQASLSVGPLTTLVPVALPGDQSPITQKEIRDYTGPLRAAAERALGQDPANLSATRLLNQMVNRLPADNSFAAQGLAALRDQTMSPVTATERPAVAGLVDRAIDTCREMLRVERTPHLRACLANQHDILNSGTTQNVWRSLRPGS